MFIPLWLLALAGLVFALLAVLAFRPRSGAEMIQGQQRAARRNAGPVEHARRAPHVASLPASRPSDEAAVLGLPEVRAALAGGRKVEAIRLVRERTGLGLKEAKDLVERVAPR